MKCAGKAVALAVQPAKTASGDMIIKPMSIAPTAADSYQTRPSGQKSSNSPAIRANSPSFGLV